MSRSHLLLVPVIVLATRAARADEAIERPLVMPEGGAGFTDTFEVVKPTNMADPGEAMVIGAGVGVSDRVELGASYRFALTDFNARGAFTFYSGALAVDRERVSFALGADVAVDFAHDLVINGMRTTDTIETLHLGYSARANLTRRLAVYSGNIVAPGTVGQQLAISLEHDGPMSFEVPIGLALQANRHVLLRAQTVVARLAIAHAHDQTIFADATPLDVSALMAVARNMDVLVFWNDSDLGAASQRWAVGLAARLYAL